MLVTLSKWIVILFGLYIIVVGIVMLFAPEMGLRTLRKAGSTPFINYMEITIRLIPAGALIMYADHCTFPEPFKVFGWIMVITSLVLYIVPRKMHHGFSLKSADILKPRYVRWLSPFAFLFGILMIYNAA